MSHPYNFRSALPLDEHETERFANVANSDVGGVAGSPASVELAGEEIQIVDVERESSIFQSVVHQ